MFAKWRSGPSRSSNGGRAQEAVSTLSLEDGAEIEEIFGQLWMVPSSPHHQFAARPRVSKREKFEMDPQGSVDFEPISPSGLPPGWEERSLGGESAEVKFRDRHLGEGRARHFRCSSEARDGSKGERKRNSSREPGR